MRLLASLLTIPCWVIAATMPAAANPVFNLTYIAGTSAQAQTAFAQATNFWSSAFTDNLTINLTVGTGSLPSGILASTSSADARFSYSAFRAAMLADRTSANDFAAVNHLPNVTSVPIYINYTSNNPNGSGSPTPYLDSAGANNQTVWMSSANAKALGLVPTPQTVGGCASACDGFIEFSDGFTYDFDRSDGISGSAYDFFGLALHELAHALGFISGVDILDTNSPNPGFFSDNQFDNVTPLDMFRCSASSASEGALLDFTAGTAGKSFSLDNCATSLGSFSTGVQHGDGRQASHWKDNLGLGIMDPTAGNGELLVVSQLDLIGLDVIGWNVNVPEPLAIQTVIVWLLGLFAARQYLPARPVRGRP